MLNAMLNLVKPPLDSLIRRLIDNKAQAAAEIKQFAHSESKAFGGGSRFEPLSQRFVHNDQLPQQVMLLGRKPQGQHSLVRSGCRTHDDLLALSKQTTEEFRG